MMVFLTSRWFKPLYLYHQHLLPYLPTKQLSMLWVNLIKTFKNWDTVSDKYPHQYSLEKLWAYAMLVEAELTVRDKKPNDEYLKTSKLGSNICAHFFDNRILYNVEIRHALKRSVIFLDHNDGYLISNLNKLIGKKLTPNNYDNGWVSWSVEYEKGKFSPILCNGNYYGLLTQDKKYTVGDKNFTR